MHPPSISTSLLEPGAVTSSSLAARRSISYELNRFSLNLPNSAPPTTSGPALSPLERPVSQKIPYPSPPMSYSPPPLNSLPANCDLRNQGSSYQSSNPGHSGAVYDPPQYGQDLHWQRYTQPQQQYDQHQHRSRQQQDQRQHHNHHQHQQLTAPPAPPPPPGPPLQPQQLQIPPQHPPRLHQIHTSFNSSDLLSSPSSPYASQYHSNSAISPGTMGNGRPPFITQSMDTPQHPPLARRAKTHVASACVNCKKAHLACDNVRPCPRCVGLGKQDSCVDVQHKKRGRPRLRDERAHSFEVPRLNRPGVSSPSSPTSLSAPYRSTHRVLKSSTNDSRYSRRPSLTPREEILGQPGYFDQRVPQRQVKINLPPIADDATAYLTPNLLVVKSTEPLRELLGYPASELDCRKSLLDIVLRTDKVHHLKSKIAADIAEREHRPTLDGLELFETIQSATENQISSSIHGSKDHSEVLHLRRPDGQYLRIRIRANVVCTSIYFVVMVFAIANEMPPPLQLSNNPTSMVGRANSIAGLTPPLHSPSFLTSTNHRHPPKESAAGAQSPYGHPLIPMTYLPEQRPRSVNSEACFAQMPPHQYPNPSPSPASTAVYRTPMSPAILTPTGSNIGLQQYELQLPPLQLKTHSPSIGGIDRRRSSGMSSGVSSEGSYRMETIPRRERIGVEEMLG